ncbi:MAG TPA: sulfatase [Solirubrobacteraceae bacterium]|nr:sulfatase [Solirubrobacteraceae bacterium]
MAARVAAPLLAVLLALGLAGVAQARRADSGSDGRPNILVVMTDDEAATDLGGMPNVQRLLERQGTTFADAVDSFPLCCPARATFITGQYAHNHGVAGNFWPYGWYGMKNRGNTLPRWLQKSGYTTALIGKWLNGYGAVDAHGEIPKGFDIWRGLLDVSAYDYFNFVMNVDRRLRTWGDSVYAKKLVEFAKVEVTKQTGGLQAILAQLQKVFGPPPYSYWGSADPQDYSPDVTGKITEGLVRNQARSRKPFFIWWAPAAPHREDVSVTLLGRPGDDPRPPPRYDDLSKQFTLPRPPSFNVPDDTVANMCDHAPKLNDNAVQQLQLDYEGRSGSLLAVDDHVKRLISILRETHQLRNTLIVFVSDNGWLQGQHAIPGDKYLPYDASLRVPFIVRGPGVRRGQTVHGQVSNIDFAPTLLSYAHAKAGRTMDGVSLVPTIRRPARRPRRTIEIEATAPLFMGDVPNNAWDRPWSGVRTDRWTYVRYKEAGDEQLFDRTADPFELHNLATDPAYAAIKTSLAARLAKLAHCKGQSCDVPG